MRRFLAKSVAQLRERLASLASTAATREHSDMTEEGMGMDAVELWRDSIPEESRVEAGMGAALVGAGVVAALLSLAGGRRGLLAWAVPGALLSAGLVLIVRTLADVRSDRIAETQASIETQLSSLDPIARAYVLKNVGEGQLRAMLPRRP